VGTMRGVGRKALVGSAVLVAGLGIACAAWAESTPAPASGTLAGAPALVASTGSTGAGPAAARPGGRRLGRLLRHSDHATIEVDRQGQWVTYSVDRGKVTAASPTSITLARPDGQSVTLAIDGSTKFRGVASASSVRTGQPALVVSENGVAVAVRQGRPGRPSAH